jgi:hypothetical protein
MPRSREDFFGLDVLDWTAEALWSDVELLMVLASKPQRSPREVRNSVVGPIPVKVYWRVELYAPCSAYERIADEHGD